MNRQGCSFNKKDIDRYSVNNLRVQSFKDFRFVFALALGISFGTADAYDDGGINVSFNKVVNTADLPAPPVNASTLRVNTDLGIPSMSGNNIAFSWQYRIVEGPRRFRDNGWLYLDSKEWDSKESLQVLDTWSVFNQSDSTPSIEGDKVAFILAGDAYWIEFSGRSDIRLEDKSSVSSLFTASANCKSPGHPAPFCFGAFLSQPTMRGNTVAYTRMDNDIPDNSGIFTIQSGNVPVPIVTSADAIPEGQGNFSGFGNPLIGRRQIVFLGADSAGRQGLYAWKFGRLNKIVDTNTRLPRSRRAFTGFHGSIVVPMVGMYDPHH